MSRDISSISGIEAGLRDELAKLGNRGVQIGAGEQAATYSLRWGGEVAHSGNCLFEAVAAALGAGEPASSVRLRCVAQFQALRVAGALPPDIDQTIRNLYCPDLAAGWAVNFIQEHKLLVPAVALARAEALVASQEAGGASYNDAAEAVFREVGAAVDSAAAWARYMALGGSASDAARMLLSVDVAGAGMGAFGDDLAIECLAAAYGRDIYVVQAHGEDAGSGAGGALFFLPHRSLGGGPAADGLPLFLLMKGCGWTSAGADHFEPLICSRCLCPAEEPYIIL
ncbi:hypothetical protein WJX81_001215 [Elliptochloris bilobata]|uniref:OTU domain-containing protein n=1 Tax=Elliptochloris bilobata TaxID=381761 RepID=A0AAW1S9C5_9CHLO